MSSVRNSAAGWAIAALILFSFVVAYSAVSAADILIDPLGEVEALVFLCLLPAVVIGWILFRGMSSQPEIAVRSEPEEEPHEAAIAAPRR